MKATLPAIKIIEVLDKLEIPYAIGGGLAIAAYGVPRLTYDIDMSIGAMSDAFLIDATIKKLQHQCDIKFREPIEIIRKRAKDFGMVRCYYEGVGIDMFFPSTEYMNEIIQRAIALPLSNHTCQIVDINDLVVMKGIFGRSKDLVDIESLARYGARSIDLNFVEKHISEIMHPSDAAVHIGHVRRAIEKGLLERQDADAYTESITQDNSPEQKCASTPKP